MENQELEKLWLVDENNACLYTAPRAVEDFTLVPRLSAHMFDVMKQTNGVGLSANQIGVDASMFVMKWPDMGEDKAGSLIVVNPRITEYSKNTSSFEEGCLSFPGLYIWLTRPESITVEFQDMHGIWQSNSLSGWPARIFQHEFDHMQGKTFIDNASRLKLERAFKKRNKMIRKLTGAR